MPAPRRSAKPISNIGCTNRSGGIAEYGVGAEPFLFPKQQCLDELRLGGDSAGAHESAEKTFANADRDGAAGGHGDLLV
jgi:hypothetical protein